MSKANGKAKGTAPLSGIGAAYVRVSDDDQDTKRQFAAIRSFETRNDVRIPKHYLFKDEGWARDKADRRPDFQRMMRLVEQGAIQWIVVDKLDRFGTKNAKQLFVYLYRLEEAGCRLFDASGKEWTGEDDATEITALIEGKNSTKEQRDKSHRVLSGKVEKAKDGEWQGGPVRLGFDVACFDRESSKEIWRVVFEARDKRLKVYPDGKSERSDGKDNFPRAQPTQRLQVVPSKDKAKIEAAVTTFKRFARETIPFTALARSLNEFGFANGYGGAFQGQQVEAMLEDPIYLGYYTWNKRHSGKFHRYSDGQTIREDNYEEEQSKNDPADWIWSKRLFKPLVDQKTWDAVQAKLAKRTKRTRASRSPAAYLSGLVYCGGCGQRMVSGRARKPKSKARKDGSTGERHEYFCGTYHKAAREGRVAKCSCRRNGVFQDELEPLIEQWLKETGTKLDLLNEALNAGELTAPLKGQELNQWREFQIGLGRLASYLAKHHPDEFRKVLDSEWYRKPQLGRSRIFPAHVKVPLVSADYVPDLIATYERCFDPSNFAAERDRLDAEHTKKTHAWADLLTPKAKEKATRELEALEARLTELDNQSENLAETVKEHYQQVSELTDAIDKAERSMRAKDGERALRQRAAALGEVIDRIVCEFESTGKKGGGWGKKNDRLTKVSIHPLIGEPATFSADSKGTLLYSSAHSCI